MPSSGEEPSPNLPIYIPGRSRICSFQSRDLILSSVYSKRLELSLGFSFAYANYTIRFSFSFGFQLLLFYSASLASLLSSFCSLFYLIHISHLFENPQSTHLRSEDHT